MKNIEDKCEKILRNVFGYDSFRPMQLDVIKSVLSGKDTLAIMPTGGGKSVCCQIPALVFEGVTLVVSPLISLMQDQVASLKENGVESVFLNSSLEREEYFNAINSIKKGSAKIVYISPEGLATGKILDILQEAEKSVSCITVDEAHCVSEWGHDFRPDYLDIFSVRERFPNAVCLALTATATAQVRQDIIKNLKMKNPSVFVSSFNRENIFLEVRPKKNALQQICEYLNAHQEESGIIYCFSRKQVDQLTQSLSEKGFSVEKYHAGLDDKERVENQNLFITDKVQIMVATVAFGMGINKPNVRFVMHYDIPKSLEEYYQEIGRAGRDGLPSTAILFYSGADIHKIRFFFEDSADSQKSENLLKSMINYATSRQCRRKVLLSYFGENFLPEKKSSENCCDICSSKTNLNFDVTIPSQKFMCCILRTGQRYGVSYIIDVLIGSRQKRILDNHHETLSTWGIGKELSKEDWFSLSDALIDAGFIFKSGEYNVLKLSDSGKIALSSRECIKLPVVIHQLKVLNQVVPKKAESAIHKKGDFARNLCEQDLILYNDIKVWRKNLAEEMNVPPYVIFGDKTLEELVEKKPRTKAELLKVFGIGEVKAEKIGDAILRLVSGK